MGTLYGRNNVTSDKVDFRSDMKQNIFWKKSGNREFVCLLKQFGATVLGMKYQT